MNTTHKMIVVAAFALNVGAVAAVSGVALNRYLHDQADPIQLGTIVVTPADAAKSPAELGTIVVTPSDADWRYAEAHGVQRPAVESIALGTIVVRPNAEQLADLADAMPTRPTATSVGEKTEDVVDASLIDALEAFSPGKYLFNASTLRALNALVFEGSGS